MSTIILTQSEVRQLLPMPECIQLMMQAVPSRVASAVTRVLVEPDPFAVALHHHNGIAVLDQVGPLVDQPVETLSATVTTEAPATTKVEVEAAVETETAADTETIAATEREQRRLQFEERIAAMRADSASNRELLPSLYSASAAFSEYSPAI